MYLVNDFLSLLANTRVEAKDFIPTLRQTPVAQQFNDNPVFRTKSYFWTLPY